MTTEIKKYMNQPDIIKICERNINYKWLREYNAENKQSLVVPHSGRHAGFMGMAFNYAIGFHIANGAMERVNWDVAHDWKADHIYNKMVEDTEVDENAVVRLGKIIERSHALFDEYASGQNTNIVNVATWSQYLAYAEGRVYKNTEPFTHNKLANEELIKLIQLFPLEDVLDAYEGEILLKPRFNFPDELSSFYAGDADLIIGRSLIDMRVTQQPRISVPEIRELVGSAVIATNNGCHFVDNETGITDIGVYNARHGDFSTISISEIVNDFKGLSQEIQHKMKEDAGISKPGYNMPGL